MNILALNSMTHRWRDAGRWLLFIVLVLGMAKAPLAYGCIPVPDSAGHARLTVAASTCDEHRVPVSEHGEQSECCIFEISTGLRGAENGFLFQPITEPQFDQLDQPDTGLPAVRDHTESRRHLTAAILTPSEDPGRYREPLYLLTQRLRI